MNCTQSQAAPPPPVRVISYIDGFNLYFGLHDSGLRQYYWLNVRALTESLLRPNQALQETKYFTSRISGAQPGDPPRRAAALDDKRERQSTFLDALATVANVRIFEGHYLAKPVTCHKCGAWWRSFEEKMTDVNIATELLMDATQDRFDTALVVSADSDLVPPIRAVRKFFPEKRVVVAFPLGRNSAQLKQAANAYLTIGRNKYKASQLAEQIVLPNGHVLCRPTRWQ